MKKLFVPCDLGLGLGTTSTFCGYKGLGKFPASQCTKTTRRNNAVIFSFIEGYSMVNVTVSKTCHELSVSLDESLIAFIRKL